MYNASSVSRETLSSHVPSCFFPFFSSSLKECIVWIEPFLLQHLQHQQLRPPCSPHPLKHTFPTLTTGWGVRRAGELGKHNFLTRSRAITLILISSAGYPAAAVRAVRAAPPPPTRLPAWQQCLAVPATRCRPPRGREPRREHCKALDILNPP